MDRRMTKAAATGNVEELERLMREDILVLDSIVLLGAQTPLHIASMCGHLSFVQNMLKLKKQFLYELNEDGFTPMHLASANGHVEVVLEFLKVDHELCHIQGKEGILPLHCASVKGRIHVMTELLSAAPLSVQSKTARGETPLHIAVKNNRFDAFKLLLEHAKGRNIEGEVLNDKDNQANTVLHLALSRKQYQIVDMLLVEDDVVKKVMVVNSVNERGMTPLDVLTVFQSEAGDLEIYKSLVKAGAKSAKDIENENEAGRIEQPLEVEIVHETHVPPKNCTGEESILPKIIENFKELFGYKLNRDSTNDGRNVLLTVAALMMTATYQAVLSPPGGVWQDDTHPYSAGKSIVATKSRGTFLLFILGNSIGYYTSFHMINILTSDFPHDQHYLLILLSFFMSSNYTASMLSLVPSDDKISNQVAWLLIMFGWAAPLLPSLLRRLYFLAQKLPNCAYFRARFASLL